MYGSTPAESIPIPKTERTKDVYYKNGKEISERHLIEAIMNNDYDEKKCCLVRGTEKRRA